MRHRVILMLSAGCVLGVACSYYDSSLLGASVGQPSAGGAGGGAGGAAAGATGGGGTSAAAGSTAAGDGGAGGANPASGASGTGGDPGSGGTSGGRAGEGGVAGAGGAGAGGIGAAGGAGGGPMCAHAEPPGPPAAGGNGGGTMDLVFAVKTLDFGDKPPMMNGQPTDVLGYDLDRLCTCAAGEGRACLTPKGAMTACDGPNGQDNAAGALIYDVKSNYFMNFGSQVWNGNIASGIFSVLLRVRDYNGQPDDDQVELDWYVPLAFNSVSGDPSAKPQFDGTDAWPVSANTLMTPVPSAGGAAGGSGGPGAGGKGGGGPGTGGSASGGSGANSSGSGGSPSGGAGSGGAGAASGYDIDKPIAFDKKAYVSGGVLVGSLPTTELQVAGALTVALTAAFVTGKLVPPGGATKIWTLQNGVLAGRWQVQQVLAQIGTFHDPFQHKFVCTDNLLYAPIKAKVCNYVDLYSGIGSPTTPCDSLSIGFALEAVQAKLGPIVQVPVAPPPCPPATDPGKDTCP